MLGKRIQSEIDSFFSNIFDVSASVRQSSSSAFTQCRDKINFTAFVFIFRELVCYYYTHFSFKRYYGYRLIAVDGSVFSLPRTEELINEFGDNLLSNSKKWIKAQVSFATDVLNNICVDAELSRYTESERDQAIRLISRLGKGNFYLFDRGYFSRDFLRCIANTKCGFCFRVKRDACSEITQFINNNINDIITYIAVEQEQIKVRLTKIILSSGEEEYLLSSLFDIKNFSPKKLKELYHLRWGVEEQFKDMKYAICAENFVGKKVNSIKQEFYANILTYNLSMMMCKTLVDKISNKKKKKHKHKTNKRALLAKIKQCFVELFLKEGNAVEIIENIINTLLKETIPIRNGRKYHRNETIKAKRKYCRAYVPVV